MRRGRALRRRSRAGRGRVGHSRSSPSRLRPRTPRRRSSPSCTPRRRPACATTSSRSAAARATRSCSSTASRRSAASPSRSTAGASTSRTAARRSASACRPGLAPLTCRTRARERLVERSQSWYLDLRMIADYAWRAAGRTYHHTAPTAMIVALHAGLGAMLDEGLEASWARHEECGRLLQDGLEKLGFRCSRAEGHRLPELTTVWVPERRRRRGRGATHAARALRHRDRRRARRRSPARCGASAAWATPRDPATWRCCSVRSPRCSGG